VYACEYLIALAAHHRHSWVRSIKLADRLIGRLNPTCIATLAASGDDVYMGGFFTGVGEQVPRRAWQHSTCELAQSPLEPQPKRPSFAIVERMAGCTWAVH
jgi:hypothetical protein